MIEKKAFLTLAIIAAVAATAFGDWATGDPHKMHHPQLPDPTGWDVDVTQEWVADDWRCTGSGPVSGIHFWISWEGENVGPIDRITTRIWDDVPANSDPDPLITWSHPGEEQWERTFFAASGDFVVGPAQVGLQGWFTPGPNGYFNPPPDHFTYYQVNIADIASPFNQQFGETYWLEIHIYPEMSETKAGWKTTLDGWNDAAVYEDNTIFYPLYVPGSELQVPLDMAFVITPEPASMAILGLGGLGVLARRRRKRS